MESRSDNQADDRKRKSENKVSDKEKEEHVSQEMWVAFNNWKEQESRFSPKASVKDNSLAHLNFSPVRTVLAF